jgi:hypothetical protein
MPSRAPEAYQYAPTGRQLQELIAKLVVSKADPQNSAMVITVAGRGIRPAGGLPGIRIEIAIELCQY